MILSGAHLVFDLGLVLSASWLLYWRLFAAVGLPLTSRLLAIALLALGQVVAVGLALGYLGWLTASSLTGAHLLTLMALLATTPARPPLRGVAAETWRGLRRSLAGWTVLEKLLGGLLLVLLALLVVPAVWGEPRVHDSLSYRLSRIGYWLQEQSITYFRTNEDRQNYTPINADLVMLWLVAHFRQGYLLAALAQFSGGILLLLAVWDLGSELELPRPARLGSLFVLLAMPNVAAQFTTTHTDLLTTGLLTSGVRFLLRAAREPRFAWPGWLGVGLAVGAKPTVFFWMPGLLVLGLLWAGVRQPSVDVLKKHLLPAALCVILLGLPRYIENAVHYQNLLGSPRAMALNAGERRGTWLQRGALNGYSFFIQLLEPASNPFVLQPLLEPAWRRLVNTLPEEDDFAVQFYPRRQSLLLYGGLGLKNADTLSCGAIAGLLSTFGLAASLWGGRRRHDAGARLWLGVGAAVLLFFVAFSVLFLWWPCHFRYFCLPAGFMALLAAFGIHRAGGQVEDWVWPLVAIAAALGLLEMIGGTFNAGFRTIQPAQPLYDWEADLLAEKRAITQVGSAPHRVGVLLPWNSVLAGFFRVGVHARICFLETDVLKSSPTAEEVLRETRLDALITRPGFFANTGGAIVTPVSFVSNDAPRLLIYRLPEK